MWIIYLPFLAALVIFLSLTYFLRATTTRKAREAMELQTDAYERVWSHELQKSDDVVGGGGGDGGGCDENADRKGRGGSRNRDLIRRSNSRRSVLIDSDQAQGETHTNAFAMLKQIREMCHNACNR
jgi:hypothetical protein